MCRRVFLHLPNTFKHPPCCYIAFVCAEFDMLHILLDCAALLAQIILHHLL